MSKTEKRFLVYTSILLWAVLALFAGGPIYSDEMLYIDTGLRNLVNPHYGNRYFHIYLQKLFMTVFPTPLTGIRVFWGLLMASTTALIYFNARRFTEESTILHGVMAVAVFFSFSIIHKYSGEPAVDITAMAVVSVYVTVYLQLLRQKNEGKNLLFALGLLAFFGLKTKETTIFMHILLLGLLKGKFTCKRWLKKLIQYFQPFLIGIAVGVVVFIILDGFILGQPFFAISPSTFKGVFDNYNFSPGFYFGPTSWYTEYLFDDILLPFMLFLIGGILVQKDLDGGKRILWVFPLIYISFLSWNMLKVPWGFIERFIYPALPVIAILSTQAVKFKWPQAKKEWIWFVVSTILLGGVAVVMRVVWMRTARTYFFDYARMLDAIYFPILLSILLAVIIWKSESDWKWTLVELFCIGTLLFTPISNSIKYFALYPQVRERYQEINYPLRIFSDELIIQENDLIYISTNIKEELDMLSTDPNDITGMYNFYFDERIGDENIFIGYNRKKVSADLLNREFTYALLSGNDVETLKKLPVWESITDKYSRILKDEEGAVYLLLR